MSGEQAEHMRWATEFQLIKLHTSCESMTAAAVHGDVKRSGINILRLDVHIEIEILLLLS